jgi:hypothetical protein
MRVLKGFRPSSDKEGNRTFGNIKSAMADQTRTLGQQHLMMKQPNELCFFGRRRSVNRSNYPGKKTDIRRHQKAGHARHLILKNPLIRVAPWMIDAMPSILQAGMQQITGSFKCRGAMNGLLCLSPRKGKKGVV